MPREDGREHMAFLLRRRGSGRLHRGRSGVLRGPGHSVPLGQFPQLSGGEARVLFL